MTEYSCERAKEMMAAAWSREIDETAAAALQSHLDDCTECAAEMALLGNMWEKLGDLPVPEPSLAMRVRWEQTTGIAHALSQSFGRFTGKDRARSAAPATGGRISGRRIRHGRWQSPDCA